MTPREVLGDHSGDDCCDVTTTGRRSGRPHKIEIWFGVIDDTMYLISGNGPGADERRRVGDLMGAKYGWDGDPSIGLSRQAWCYEVPVLAISEWA